MRRKEMIQKIESKMYTYMYEDFCPDSDVILDIVESLGMLPPCLPPEKCQELLNKYIDPNLNKWEDECS